MKPSVQYCRFLLEQVWEGFLDLLYPRLCASCRVRLCKVELALCCSCASRLGEYQADDSEERLWASPIFRHLYSLYVFRKGSVCQRLVHSYKYHHNWSVAKLVGKRTEIKYDSWRHVGYDMVLAIPLSPRRKAERGYNQALLIAREIAKWLGIEASDSYIRRKRDNVSHTQLRGIERRLKTQGLFEPNPKYNIDWKAKRILLVDDILTTGSTLLAYLDVLELLGAKEVDVFTIAVAK